MEYPLARCNRVRLNRASELRAGAANPAERSGDSRGADVLPLHVFGEEIAGGFERVQVSRELNRGLRRSTERTALGPEIAGLPGGCEQERVEGDQTVGCHGE